MQPPTSPPTRTCRQSRKSRSTSRCRCRAPARPPPELDADSDQAAVIVAAATSDTPSDMDLPLPAARPGDPATTRSRRSSQRRLTKKRRPTKEEPDEGEDAYTVASCRPTYGGRAFPTSPEEIIPEAKATIRRCSAMPRRRALRSSTVLRGPIRHRRSVQGSRRPPRARRPVRKDARREAKPKVIAAQPQAARWALDSSYVLPATRRAPRCRRLRITWCVRRRTKSIRPASSKAPQVADASRFTGKAVTFMTVARFSTN